MNKFIIRLTVASMALISFPAFSAAIEEGMPSQVVVANEILQQDSVGDIAFECGVKLGVLVGDGLNEAARKVCLSKGLVEPVKGQRGMRVVVWNTCIRKVKAELWKFVNLCLAQPIETE